MSNGTEFYQGWDNPKKYSLDQRVWIYFVPGQFASSTHSTLEHFQCKVTTTLIILFRQLCLALVLSDVHKRTTIFGAEFPSGNVDTVLCDNLYFLQSVELFIERQLKFVESLLRTLWRNNTIITDFE